MTFSHQPDTLVRLEELFIHPSRTWLIVKSNCEADNKNTHGDNDGDGGDDDDDGEEAMKMHNR